MPILEGDVGLKGNLGADIVRAPKHNRVRSVRIPGLGRFAYTRDPGEANLFSNQTFQTHLQAVHRRKGELLDVYDLGAGLVTNVGVMAMANDAFWAAPSAASCATLALAKFHASGTGTTAAATTDIKLETPKSPTETECVEGSQEYSSAANVQKYKTNATMTYSESLAITEWGLHTAKILSATTGTPFTATSSTEATVTAEPYTESSTSVKGEQQLIVRAGTTAVYALITSNTKKILKFPAWYKVADGTAGSTPGSTEAFTIKPVIFDHRVISALNVVSGDEVTWKYSLEIKSGG